MSDNGADEETSRKVLNTYRDAGGNFLDTANIDEIRHGVRLGVVSGVTTNPSLAAKEGIGALSDYKISVLEIAHLVQGI